METESFLDQLNTNEILKGTEKFLASDKGKETIEELINTPSAMDKWIEEMKVVDPKVMNLVFNI